MPAQPRAPVRLLGAAAFLLTVAVVIVIRALLWDAPRPAETIVEHLLVLLSVTWALPVLPALLMFAGYAAYGRRQDRMEIVSRPFPPDVPLVSFRVVTRGENVRAVRATVENICSTMRALPLFPYVVEVVSDVPVIDDREDVRALVVPAGFATPTGARFKARALAYALDASSLNDRDWVFHLDEESHITASVVAGIREVIAEEDQRECPRIGQGLIVYSRSLRDNPFFALADSIRSGDDLGRFHMQARLGITLVGLHGSFVLARTDVERAAGFDVGPRGSVTEDAWWALVAMAQGTRSRWVEGVVIEQSPRRVTDFLRQRRRWFIGLQNVVRFAPVPRRWRLPLALSVWLWALSWLSILWTFANLAFGLQALPGVAALGTIVLAAYVAQYVVGLRLNLDVMPPEQRPGPARRAMLYVAQIALIPVFATLEGLAVIWGLLRPDLGFHVIDKD